jgi:hypothetical protein
MPALHPAWNPFTAGLAEAGTLHLSFAISPVGPSLSHPPAGMEAVGGPQNAAAWHELTLVAQLVCLAVEEVESRESPEALIQLAPSALAGEETGRMAGPVSLAGRSPDEEWMTLPMMPSTLDGAWILP